MPRLFKPLSIDGASEAPISSGRLIALFVVLALLWFGTLDYRKLIKPDEGRYAEIAREMMVTGDWLTPRLNDLKYFEKPPLQYWATAAAYKIFGLHEWTARLWSALTGFATLLFAAYAAGRLYGRNAGLYAAAVLASSALFTSIGHLNTLDMGLCFFMNASLFCTLLAQQAEAKKNRRRWMLGAWAAMAGAVLSKGLIGVVLPSAVLALYVLASRDWRFLRQLELLGGSALFFILTAPWFIAVSIANPEFAHFFFIHEHFERFLTTEHRRTGAWWYFVPIFAAGALPWLTLMLSGLLSGLMSGLGSGSKLSHQRSLHAASFDADDHYKPQLLLLLWIIVIFIFFSASGSKLPSYILPIFPALAVLAARTLTTINARALRLHIVLVIVLMFAALALVSATFWFKDLLPFFESSPAYVAYRLWILTALALALLGSVYAYTTLAQQARQRHAILSMAMAGLLAWTAVLLGHENLRRTTSSYDLAAQIKPLLDQASKPGAPALPFYSLGNYDQTLNFYLQRTVTLVAFRDEMDLGLQQEPAKGIADVGTFIQRWQADAQAFAMMDVPLYASLQKKMAMQEIFNDGRRVVVMKKAVQ